MVVMEATGGFEKLPFGLLWQQGIPCAIVNPRSVRRFAEAIDPVAISGMLVVEDLGAYTPRCAYLPKNDSSR